MGARPTTAPSRPLIGVTTSEVRLATTVRPTPEGEPPQHEMALGLTYLRAVERAGGLPVVLPPLELDAAPGLLDHLDGLVLSGGPDLAPDAYGAAPDAQLGPTEPELDAFEYALALAADRAGLPVLGICRGLQALNVARGGTLVQHLPDVTDGSVEHRQHAAGRQPTHTVRVAPGSAVERLTGGGDALEVNSFHHQAARAVGRDLVPVAWAPDGTVEALEGAGGAGGRFVVAVQWHAETLVDRAAHLGLFTGLVAAATARGGARRGTAEAA